MLSIVQRFSMRGENMDDLFQIGCVGLAMKAIDNFDISVGVRFSTYACPMIRGKFAAICGITALCESGRSLKDTAYRAFAVSRELAERNVREPTIDEIAQEMGVSREELCFALDAVQDPISISQPIYQEGGDALYVLDSLSDEKTPPKTAFGHCPARCHQQTGRTRKNIIRLRYFGGKHTMEVSREWHQPGVKVSRLEKNASRLSEKNYT